MFVDVSLFLFSLLLNYSNAAYPAVYGQFPQAIPQPLAAVAPSQREGKSTTFKLFTKKKKNHTHTHNKQMKRQWKQTNKK